MWVVNRRTEISFEIDRYLIIRRREGAAKAWCCECASEETMVTPDEAAALTSTSTRFLYRLIDGGSIHFDETASGLVRICLASLLNTLETSAGRSE